MSSVEEHLATRRAAGLFDFSFMGLYELSTLEGVLSRRLEHFEPGQIAYTLLLNQDGSVFNDATVWRMDADRWWLFTGRRTDFQRFRDIARDRSGEYTILALQGPASGTILAHLIGRESVLELKYFRFIKKSSMVIARLGYSGELGYELMVPVRDGPSLRQALLDHSVPECSFDAANSLRIESGYVLFDREIDGRANPRELGLERFVSANRDFALTRKLAGLEILDQLAVKDAQLAQLTSECFSPTFGKRLGLGFVPPGLHSGDRVRLADGRAARLAALPFYDPERRLPRDPPLVAT